MTRSVMGAHTEVARMGGVGASTPRFRVLGVTEVLDHGVVIDIGAPQQRCVLALLLLDAGQVVSLGRLIDAVWPDAPPATARKAIQVYISHLRRALSAVPGVTMSTVRPGYRLDVVPDDVDAHRFRSLVGQARNVSTAASARLLSEALDLWRGPAVADLPDSAVRELLVAGLEEQRLTAIEQRIAAELALGHAAQLVCELTAYVATHPLREGGHRLLMRALFGCGRQVEALAAYQNARAMFMERLGTEPGPEMRSLHERVLRGDLDVSSSGAPRVAASFSGR